jgi:hypothetical protein
MFCGILNRYKSADLSLQHQRGKDGKKPLQNLHLLFLKIAGKIAARN